MFRPIHSLLKLFGLFSCFLLAACGAQEVYGNLKESEANEMISVLRTASIEASKGSAGEGKWSISVDQAQFSRAVQVLRANGYPKDEFESLGKIFEKKGFVSSPVEERARLHYGLSQELSNTISQIDGVVDARVHLAIPEADPLSEKTRPSSAAVFIKYQPGFDLRNQTGSIKALVMNSIEGLSYEKVSVLMFQSQVSPPPPAMSLASFAPPMRVLFGLLLVGAAILVFFGRRRWSGSAQLPSTMVSE